MRVSAQERGGGGCELPRVADRSRTPSQACLSCHDGSAGTRAGFFGSGAPGFGANHPVEVDYRAAAARAADRYVPAARLPPLVPLVNGKVTCTTCHDGASPFAKHVIDPERLCFACHRM